MYCLPPIDTIEEGVAVTDDGVIPDGELTTILKKTEFNVKIVAMGIIRLFQRWWELDTKIKEKVP